MWETEDENSNNNGETYHDSNKVIDPIKLKTLDTFKMKKSIYIPYTLSSYSDISNSDNDKIYRKPADWDNIQLSIDRGCNLLYILERNTKLVRRIPLDKYYSLDANTHSKLIYDDEYILDCKNLRDPGTIFVSTKYLFISDNRSLYLISKVHLQITNKISLPNLITIMRMSESKNLLFYSSDFNKGNDYFTSIYSMSLNHIECSNGCEKKVSTIITFVKSQVDEPDLNLSNSYHDKKKSQQESQYAKNHDKKREQNNNTICNDNHTGFIYTDTRLVSKEDERLLDICLSDRHEIIFILTSMRLIALQYDGGLLGELEFLSEIPNFGKYFKPTSLDIDEENGDIFIGNNADAKELSFLAWIKYYPTKNPILPHNMKKSRQKIQGATTADNKEQQETKVTENNIHERKGAIPSTSTLESITTDMRFKAFLQYQEKSQRILVSEFIPLCDYADRMGPSSKEIVSFSDGYCVPNNDSSVPNSLADNENTKAMTSLEQNEVKSHNQKSPKKQNIENILPNMKVDFLDKTQIYDISSPVIKITKFLDSFEDNARWNKIKIDHIVSQNSSIEVMYYCTNNKPNDECIQLENEDWTRTGKINSQYVFLGCVGRYLKLRFVLSSSCQQESPQIDRITVYFSYPSYLKHLPSIYQENEESKAFLERFFGIFETFLESSHKTIESFPKLIDPNSTPKEYLPWLSSWTALSFDRDDWSVDAIRIFLNRSHEIFKKRGTKEGLEDILSIYLNYPKTNNNTNESKDKNSSKDIQKSPSFSSSFSSLSSSHLSTRFPFDPSSNYRDICDDQSLRFFVISEEIPPILNHNEGPMRDEEGNNNISTASDYQSIKNMNNILPYHFFITINPNLIDHRQEESIRKIIDREKPAHTVAIIVRPPNIFYLNKSYLGVNAVIQGQERLSLDNSRLGIDTVTSFNKDQGKVGVSKVGVSTILY